MAATHVLKASAAAALATVALVVAAPANGALAKPVLLDPGAGASLEALPAFAWGKVSGAETYEFQVSADQNFNSPVLGRGEGSFSTRNTRATLKKTLPNGTYWWRVRASTRAGATSPWSQPRSFKKNWSGAPASLSPAPGFPFAFPTGPIKLNWSPVPHAASYLFSLASDPALANIVENGGKPVETWATNFVPTFSLLPSGTYYWNVVPLDSQGNRGAPSTVSSFNWSWPSQTTAQITDLMAPAEMFDPQFSWDPVPGATRYEVEVNSSVDFAPGSKVCCTQTTISTSLSPTVVFRDNTYYWRVRALDAAGNAGVWNIGAPFSKTFDKVPPVAGDSIKNLRLRDHLGDPGDDLDPAAGYQTDVPILVWDPVPGASSYLVEVAPHTGVCAWGAAGSWRVTTSVPTWTPLGSQWNQVKPYPDATQMAYDFTVLNEEDYCVRVRAKGERDTQLNDVFGDFTYIDDGTGNGTAFEWTGYPSSDPCDPSCNAGYLGANDYLVPARGTATGRTPLFTWEPVDGAASYFVLVAKDPNFSNIVDYAFTQLPAYSPRNFARPTTYSDETTLYYWAVLPASGLTGGGAVGNPLAAAASNFQKASTPPSQLSPAEGTLLTEQPVFRWTGVEGARRYRFQVAQEPTFASPVEDVVTASTSYTPFTTHPADTTLYWRVRADDENQIGLTWSAVRTFQRKLPTPTLAGDNATIGDFTPAWTWSHVPGASGYTFSMDGPTGADHKEWAALRQPAAAFVYIFGPGIWRWRVRAEFPKLPSGTAFGPWSSYLPFTRTLSEPGGSRTSVSKTHVLLSWTWKLGAKNYRLQISQRPDFATNVEEITTDNTSYAPTLTHPFFQQGGTFYWRVASMDKASNVGDWTAAQKFSLLRSLRLAVSGRPVRRRWSRLTVNVSDSSMRPVARATVRVSGAGIRARRARTNRSGRVTFRLRAPKRGQLAFSATKAGFGPGALRLRVR